MHDPLSAEFPDNRLRNLVLPEIIVAVSLLVVLLALGMPLNAMTVVLGHTLICMPFAIAILNGSFGNLDASIEEVTIDLGKSRWSSFRHVTLPIGMALGTILAGLSIALLCVAEWLRWWGIARSGGSDKGGFLV